MKKYWLVLIFFLVLYTLTMGGHIYAGWDTYTKLRVTESIIEDHDIILAWEGDTTKPYYSYFPIGQSLAFIPFYLSGKMMTKIIPAPPEIVIEFFVSWYNVLISSLICMLLFFFLTRLGYKIRTALLTTLVLGFATLMWPYSKMVWSEPTYGLFLLAIMMSFWKFLNKKDLKWLMLIGSLLGFATLFRLEAFVLSIPFLIFIILQSDNRRHSILQCLIFIMFLTIVFSANLFYNYIRFGGIFNFGYPQASFQWAKHAFFSRALKNIAFYSISFNESLLLFSPPVILFFFSISRFYKTHRSIALLIILTVATHFAFFVILGGRSTWAWGPRYLVPIIPLLILPVALLIESSKLRKLTAIICGVGVLIQILSVSVSHTVVFEKLYLKKGEQITQQTFTEIFLPVSKAPLVLAGREFASYIRNMFKSKNQSVEFSSLRKKQYRDTIRMNTFDFWFLLAYFAGVPLKLIIPPVVILVLLLFLTGSCMMKLW